MNVHTRIRKTLDHEEPDRVPTLAQYFENPFIEQVLEEFSRWEKYKVKLRPFKNAIIGRLTGFDSAWIHYGRHKANIRDRPKISDEIVKKYNLSRPNNWAQTYKNGWYSDGALKTPEDMRNWISFVNSWEPCSEKYFRYYKKNVWDKNIEKGFLPIPTGGAVSYATWSSIGINRFAYMVRKHKNLVKDLAKAFGKVTKEFQTMMFEQGVDMAFVCDDWALKGRLIFHPKQWDEIIGPVFKDIADNAHKHDAKFLVHTDGNIEDCMPYIVKAGADAVEPLEYESGMRLQPLKEKYGNDITLIGNVPASDILTFGSVEDTIKMTKECIDIAAKGGGYLLGAGSDILGTCKLENVKAMIETVKTYGKYS